MSEEGVRDVIRSRSQVTMRPWRRMVMKRPTPSPCKHKNCSSLRREPNLPDRYSMLCYDCGAMMFFEERFEETMRHLPLLTRPIARQKR